MIEINFSLSPNRRIPIRWTGMLGFLLWCSVFQVAAATDIFQAEQFSRYDAILVSDPAGDVIYQWQPDQALIPASLTKLLTAYLAIDKWGLKHRFATDFYIHDTELWVQGFGDPYLISEELDLLTDVLKTKLPGVIKSLHIDASYFSKEAVPGHTTVVDPYNAPLSAVSANFNTVMLQRNSGKLYSAEPQTPLTKVAMQVADSVGSKPVRVNLVDTDLAQRYFGELLIAKLGIGLSEIRINQTLPRHAKLIYRHHNSHTLNDVLRGALEYSNNFIANQVFLLLAENGGAGKMQFATSRKYVQDKLAAMHWSAASVVDGSGLSRQNKLSAAQLNQILTKLKPYRSLLKQYSLRENGISGLTASKVYAKSGTLDGVHCLAGYLQLAGQQYQFVFMFNRNMPYRYREDLLQKLAEQLAASAPPG